MTSRGHPPAPGMMRHGSPSRTGDRLPPELAEKKLVTEIDRLASENHRLATSQSALRRDLATAQEEIDKVRAYMRSIHTESDIQIRVLLEKTRKIEPDAKCGSDLKEDLRQAHREAQTLVAERQELVAKVEKASQDLEKARNDVRRLPDILTDIDNMRLEHQKLRDIFEHKKRINAEQVEEMRLMEKDLIDLNKEVERLRTEIVNVEKRAQAPYAGAYLSSNPSNPTSLPANAYYAHGGQNVQMGIPPAGGTIPYSNVGTGPASVSGVAGGTTVAVVPPVWGAVYNPTMAPRSADLSAVWVAEQYT